MNKEKIQSFLERKIGHKKLFGIGLGFLLVASFMLSVIQYSGDLKIILYILDSILILISVSAILFASDIRHKNEE